ncbi:unnamed protein product [Calypogeia fissa]
MSPCGDSGGDKKETPGFAPSPLITGNPVISAPHWAIATLNHRTRPSHDVVYAAGTFGPSRGARLTRKESLQRITGFVKHDSISNPERTALEATRHELKFNQTLVTGIGTPPTRVDDLTWCGPGSPCFDLP